MSSARPDLVPQSGGGFAAFLYGCVGFDLRALPAGQIVSATLEVGQTAVTGDPYGLFGPLIVDTVDAGATLDLSDARIANPQGTLSTDATLGVKSLDLTTVVTRARGEGWTSFLCRCRFTTYSLQPGDNRAFFDDGADQAGVPSALPRLVVKTRD